MATERDCRYTDEEKNIATALLLIRALKTRQLQA